MIRYQVTHATRFRYTEAVTLCHNMAHLVPRETPWQACEEGEIQITPAPAVMDERADYFGNAVTHFTIQEPHKQLTIRSTHTVRLTPRYTPDAKGSHAWERVRDRLPRDRSRPWFDAAQYAYASKYVTPDGRYADYAAASFERNRPVLDAALDLTHRIYTDFRYDPKSTTVTTPTEEVFANRHGVCQDFAHLQLACLRSLGLAARYVSGYLSTAAPAGGPRLLGTDASHAWVSLFCGDSGWVDLDPTNDQIPGDNHIHVAWGRDYDDVSPVKGVILGGGEHTIDVAVDAQVY